MSPLLSTWLAGEVGSMRRMSTPRCPGCMAWASSGAGSGYMDDSLDRRGGQQYGDNVLDQHAALGRHSLWSDAWWHGSRLRKARLSGGGPVYLAPYYPHLMCSQPQQCLARTCMPRAWRSTGLSIFCHSMPREGKPVYRPCRS